MILYHAVTTFHLLEFIIHRLNNHPNDYSICVVPELLREKYPNIDLLEKKGIFDKITTFRYRKIPNNEAEICPTIDKYIGLALDGHDIKEFSEINVAGAHYYFSYWLVCNGIKFNFFEESSGILQNADNLRRIVKGINQVQYDVAEKIGMFDGNNECVEKIICNTFHGDLPNNVKIFDIGAELLKLPQDSLGTICLFFNVPSYTLEDNSAIVLTQHFTNLNMMSYDDQIMLYSSTIDYYLNKYKVCLKIHPDDLMCYDFIGEHKVIREKFPSELLPFVCRGAKCISSISSTGINNIASAYDHVISFNNEYESTYADNDLYFLVSNIINACSIKKLYVKGTNIIQLKNMLDCNGIECKVLEIQDDFEEGSYIFVHKSISTDEFIRFKNKSCILIFDEYPCDVDAKSLIKEDCISKKIIGKFNNSFSEYCKKIYIYCKNATDREAICMISYEKQLECSKIKTRVPETLDLESKVLVLEGILDATEKRLIYYINREKELMQQLSEK